jgi:hypothetical protein
MSHTLLRGAPDEFNLYMYELDNLRLSGFNINKKVFVCFSLALGTLLTLLSVSFVGTDWHVWGR